MKHLGLFEGMGGFSLAARWAGWETIAWCEWNEFGQKVLRHHFPNAEGHGDITKTDFTKYANAIDIITGGFPCQPYSTAGKRKGKEDERHLWPEMLRAIREVQPSYVVGENVLGLTHWNGGLVFDEVQADLEAQGYEVLPFLLPACAVNAPHRRDRIWFIAYSKSIGERPGKPRSNQGSGEQLEGNDATPTSEGFSERGSGAFRQPEQKQEFKRLCDEVNSNTSGAGLQGNEQRQTSYQGERRQQTLRPITEFYKGSDWQHFPTQSPLCGRDDGLSRKLDGITFPKWRNESLKAYGNAIVPEVAFEIFKAINATRSLK